MVKCLGSFTLLTNNQHVIKLFSVLSDRVIPTDVLTLALLNPIRFFYVLSKAPL
jgi:hypothetical protein